MHSQNSKSSRNRIDTRKGESNHDQVREVCNRFSVD